MSLESITFSITTKFKLMVPIQFSLMDGAWEGIRGNDELGDCSGGKEREKRLGTLSPGPGGAHMASGSEQGPSKGP